MLRNRNGSAQCSVSNFILSIPFAAANHEHSFLNSVLTPVESVACADA